VGFGTALGFRGGIAAETGFTCRAPLDSGPLLMEAMISSNYLQVSMDYISRR